MAKKHQDDNSLKPRKAPRQKRSQNTMDVILQATGELICVHGLEGFGTNQIADRAGVSIGSLYQYFPDKDAILACLIHDMRREMLDDFRKAVDDTTDQSLRVAIEKLVAAALRHHMRNPMLTQHLERAEDDLPLDHETQALKMAMAEVVTNLLRQHSIESPEDTAFDLIAVAHGLTQAATQAGQSDFDNLHGRDASRRWLSGKLNNTFLFEWLYRSNSMNVQLKKGEVKMIQCSPCIAHILLHAN